MIIHYKYKPDMVFALSNIASPAKKEVRDWRMLQLLSYFCFLLIHFIFTTKIVSRKLILFQKIMNNIDVATLFLRDVSFTHCPN